MVCYVTSFCALIRLDIAVKASNSFPISDHDTTSFLRLLLGISSLRKAEFFSCPELNLLLLKNEAASISDNENHLIIFTTRNCSVHKSLC